MWMRCACSLARIQKKLAVSRSGLLLAALAPALAPMMTLSRLPFQKREDVFQLLFRLRIASFSPAAKYF